MAFWDEFERECADAGVAPQAAIERANLHRSTLFRWKAAKVSPNLRNVEAARQAVRDIAAEKIAAA